MYSLKSSLRLALAAVLAFTAACANDGGPTAPAPSAALVDGGAVTKLLTCANLPFTFNSKLIGPAGGKLSVGPHVLEVPPGALSSYEWITAHTTFSSMVEVKFGPEGLQFKEPAKLTLKYGHCLTLPSLPLRVVYVNNNKAILEFPASSDDKSNKKVEGWINHFSSYAIAY